ncbi:hypothetical protein SEA_BAILEYBLU_55 [Arthrobacter phage BaileyBlu]|uniref:DUF7574 domain-containing protein n=1 Tax=Arthrobacter phage BaileyBlu TaxID=2910754 RepID=A0AA49GZU0_9CAUD|nr:hypothetical protein PQD78_gp55 [Arthrobacter phage BaileyBlu]UJQ87193.1 hypothetical protein SEA_BAILEYBLU_55 [Arthrobacter phage BaileyBlu]
MALVTKFNYETMTNEAVPGTEDFIAVHDFYGGGYDWSSFHAYYSPSARRFFWYTDSGCSCYGPMESVDSIGDFEVGSREDLIRAWNAWAVVTRDYDVTLDEKISGALEIRRFKEAA